MKRIGLLSDTHGHWDDSLAEFFRECDEIWHAGDIGGNEVVKRIASFKPLRAVYGNIDDQKIRLEYPPIQRFICEAVDVLITHIGGSPGRYDRSLHPIIATNPPKLLICGHSHILKVMYDHTHGFLYVNPGAAGINGFHTVRTAIRFTIDGHDIKNLEVWEKNR
jgi:hypothetical protein